MDIFKNSLLMVCCSSHYELHELSLYSSTVNPPHHRPLIKIPKTLTESFHPFQHALTEAAILPRVNVSAASHLKNAGYHFRPIASSSGSFP